MFQTLSKGNAKFEASQRIPNVQYHRFAELIGLRGMYVDDPEVPTLPPHITFAQATNMAQALVEGGPEESGVIIGAAKQVISSILPLSKT